MKTVTESYSRIEVFSPSIRDRIRVAARRKKSELQTESEKSCAEAGSEGYASC